MLNRMDAATIPEASKESDFRTNESSKKENSIENLYAFCAQKCSINNMTASSLTDIITMQNLNDNLEQSEKLHYDNSSLKLSNDSLNNSSASSSSVANNYSANPETDDAVLADAQNNSQSHENFIKLEGLEISESKDYDEDEYNETYDSFDIKTTNSSSPKSSSTLSTTIKRTHLIDLIFDLYTLSESNLCENERTSTNGTASNLIDSYVEKLPLGKSIKNAQLLTWKKRYFKLNSAGILFVYDLDDKTLLKKENDDPIEMYNIMGGRADYDETRKIISLDDSRGNCLVFRVSNTEHETDSDNLFGKWREAIDSQLIDRSDLLWVRPNHPITLNNPKSKFKNRNTIILDIGTCSIRAGLFQNEPTLPKLFAPTVCSKIANLNGKFKAGFDAFDFLLGSAAPSTIDLRKSLSTWSLNSTGSSSSCQLVFPFRSKTSIDKLNFDMNSIESIIDYVLENLNILAPHDYEIVVVTPHKLTDKVNVQFLNLLLDEKFGFKSAMIINQALLSLYFYNSNVGVVANLGEKIDIVPICNGVSFQSGVTNLSYGGSNMSDFLNSFISRGHVNFVNDIEQYFVRYVKEKSCYAALDYEEELLKFSNDAEKFSMELHGKMNEFKKVEYPQSARFKSVEGLFNPEIWGIDGVGIHKLIEKAIKSSTIDLRKEMARSVYLCGGMSRIPGLKERLEKELGLLFPPTLRIQVNCSEHSYHSAYLGAFRLIQQPEYEKLIISRDEWSKGRVNCLQKWRMM